MPCHVYCRDLHLIFFQLLCDLVRTISVHCHLKNPADNLCSLFIHDPVFLIFRVFQISVWCGACNVLPGIAFCLKGRPDLFARVFRIPLIHNVSERKKIIIPIQTVMTIIDSDQPNLLLAQHFLNLTDHQIITSQPAHILYDHRPDLPGFDGIHHADKSRAVKPCAGYSIIRKMDIWGKSMGFCIF